MKNLKIFLIFLAGIITLAMFACDSPQPPTPMHVEINQKRELVQLSDLNSNSPDKLWMQFFKQRQALEFWQELKTVDKKLRFDFGLFETLQEGISDPINQVVAGIVSYLVCHPRNLESLSFRSNISLFGEKLPAHEFLTSVPDAICQLTSLQELDLAINRIHKLPDAIGQLTGLQTLQLHVNHFNVLPEAVSLLNLKKLKLSGNPWFMPTALSLLTENSLISYARPAFPCSLRILCADYIQKNPDIFNEKQEQEVLPEELWQTKREALIKQEAWD